MDELVLLKRSKRCQFCGLCKNDHMKYGPLYALGSIVAHYYCVLLSNRINQNGDDNEGILGFLANDIEAELKRTSNTKCFYCKRVNASIKCDYSKCRKYFHLPCGLKAGSLHQFMKNFRSYCSQHRPPQIIPQSVLREAKKVRPICCICHELVNLSDKFDTLWAPCCTKTWYHRKCCQKLAHSAGYFFKCAICSDTKKFTGWMQRFGIFIPQQDASWELVPNAFEELLFKYSNCDADVCTCPEGRKKNVEDTRWEIILCQSCGSQGIHIACGKLKFVDPEWECTSCRKITKNENTNGSQRREEHVRTGESVSEPVKEPSSKKRRRVSEDLENFILDKRKKRTVEEKEIEKEEEDFEINVETIDEEESQEKKDDIRQDGRVCPEDADDISDVEIIKEKKSVRWSHIYGVLSKLKPGPLSYKLAVIQKELANVFGLSAEPDKGKKIEDPSSNSDSELEVIELSDSDEDEIEILQETFEDCRNSVRRFRVKKEPMEEQPKPLEEKDEPSLSPFEIVGAVNFSSPTKSESAGPSVQVQPPIDQPGKLLDVLKILGRCAEPGLECPRSDEDIEVEAILSSALDSCPSRDCTLNKTEHDDVEVVVIDDD